MQGVNDYIANLIDTTLESLVAASCVAVDAETGRISPTTLGRIASYFYLRYETVGTFARSLRAGMDEEGLLRLLSQAGEFNELPGARVEFALLLRRVR